MSIFELTVSAAAALALFAYGLQALSAELQERGGAALKSALGALTRSPWRGYALGVGVTALIQSSSAVSSFAVALVEAGTISLRASFSILLGANVGTTVTAWLVAFKIGGLGGLAILAGVALSLAPARWAIAGRAIFYFGLILFSLDLVGESVKPLRETQMMQALVMLAANPWVGLLIGVALTAIMQSSSIVVGLAVVFATEGLMDTAAVVPVVVGANLGSTATALMASMGMGGAGRSAAYANAIFNGMAVLAVTPLLPWLSHRFALLGEPGAAVAWAHLSFNLLVTALGFAAMPHVERWMTALAGRRHR